MPRYIKANTSKRKIIPAEDYEGLRKQFGSLLTLLHCKEEMLSHYMDKDYTLSEKRLQTLEENLESEREMNAILTEELENFKQCGCVRY